jgi:hypothetical protein
MCRSLKFLTAEKDLGKTKLFRDTYPNLCDRTKRLRQVRLVPARHMWCVPFSNAWVFWRRSKKGHLLIQSDCVGVNFIKKRPEVLLGYQAYFDENFIHGWSAWDPAMWDHGAYRGWRLMQTIGMATDIAITGRRGLCHVKCLISNVDDVIMVREELK